MVLDYFLQIYTPFFIIIMFYFYKNISVFCFVYVGMYKSVYR